MKSFLKYVLATIVGVLISSILLFFILFIGLIGAAVSGSEKHVDLKSNTLLIIDFNKPVVDRKPTSALPIGPFGGEQQLGLNNILANIKKAKDDPDIDGIYLKMNYVGAGLATIEEIRNALIDFRESGKYVTSYSEYYTQGAYYLATAGDDIYLNPNGYFNLVGLRAQGVFFNNALDKIKVKPVIIATGDYKGAGEQFSRENWSDPNREQINRILNVLWKKMRQSISGSRHISETELDHIANNLLIKEAQDAYKYGFVDSLIYKDQLIEILKKRTGTDEKDDIRTVDLNSYSKVPAKKTQKGSSKEKIAVIYASGVIVGGNGDDEQIGSEKLSKTIRKARRDSSVKAIVLRVNSPGGGSLASEVIQREVYLARLTKPVIVSMGDVAASGGYMISCSADTIIANPYTVTGSIGVVFTYFTSGGLFNWMGITFDEEKTHEHAGFLTPNRDISNAETEYIKNLIEISYNNFLKTVAEGRKKTIEEIKQVAEGRVWIAQDAKSNNLIDGYGGLEDAIEIAKEMAGLSDKYSIVELPELPDPLEKLIKELTGAHHMKMIEREIGESAKYIKYIEELKENHGLMARMPYLLEIY